MSERGKSQRFQDEICRKTGKNNYEQIQNQNQRSQKQNIINKLQTQIQYMRSNNHFVIRNGKVVSKSDAENLPSPQPARISIVKPSTIIVRHLDEKQLSAQKNNELTCLKKYYEEIIYRYEQRIKQLEKELSQRNFIIQKLNLEKGSENEAKSTARDSRTSANSGKDQASGVTQSTIQTKDIFNDQKLLSKVNETSSLRNSKYESTEKLDEKIKKSCDQNKSLSSSIYKSSSQSSIEAKNQLVLIEIDRNETEQKASFDTSTLMARLNKSASLVRNIKKFLEPANMSPDQCSGVEPPESPKVRNQQTQVIPIMNNSTTSSETESQLPKFIDELVDKHEQILYLMQSLTLEKDMEIKQIKQHYEQIIAKLQKNRASSSFKYYSKSNSKIALKNFTQNKQNNHVQKINDKYDKEEVKQKNNLELCRNKYQQVDWDQFSDSQASSKSITEVVQVQEQQFF